eukprot:8016165-Pyramimonas_sp.AAC.1
MQESRSRVGHPCNWFRRRALDTQESRSRIGLSSDLRGNRAIARALPAIHPVFTLQQHACSTWPLGPAFPPPR